MYYASDNGHTRIVQLLIQAGANMDIPTPEVSHFSKDKYHYSIYVQDGYTALHAACLQGHVEVVRQFTQAGCNRIIDTQTKVLN